MRDEHVGQGAGWTWPLSLSRSAALGLIILGFALRLFRLGHQSLWYDEAKSLYDASHPLGEMFDHLPGEHVPLYYLILKAWVALTGDSELALRFLSLLLGLLILPALYVLGRRLFSRGTALMGLLLAVVSPALIFYSQETRMYSLATLLSVVSIYSMVRLLDGDRRWWLGYALSTAGAWYSHYLTLLLVPAQGVYALLWAGRRGTWRRPVELFQGLWPFASALMVSGLLWLPWLGRALNSYSVDTTYFPGTLDLAWAANELIVFLAVGWFAGDLGVVSFLFLPLVVAGALRLWRSRAPVGRASHGLLLVLLLVVAVALFFLVAYHRPKFSGHYFLFITPAYLLLSAYGLMGALGQSTKPMGQAMSLPLGRIALFGLGATLLVSIQVVSLVNYYFDPAFARDDWRSASAYLKQQRQGDERVVLISSHAFPVLEYYFGADFDGLPKRRHFSVRNLVRPEDAAALARSVGKGRLWLVLWQDEVVDPEGMVVEELDRRLSCPLLSREFGNIAILAYSARKE